VWSCATRAEAAPAPPGRTSTAVHTSCSLRLRCSSSTSSICACHDYSVFFSRSWLCADSPAPVSCCKAERLTTPRASQSRARAEALPRLLHGSGCPTRSGCLCAALPAYAPGRGVSCGAGNVSSALLCRWGAGRTGDTMVECLARWVGVGPVPAGAHSARCKQLDSSSNSERPCCNPRQVHEKVVFSATTSHLRRRWHTR